MQTIPEVIYSITAGSDISGFVYSKFKWKYISRKELVPRIAIMLGGHVAEEMIFGKDYLTAGAASDINKATNLLSIMYKDSGMGSLPISYAIPGNSLGYDYHNYKPIEEEIKNTIEQALKLARITLLKEKTLLIKMADYLSDNRMLKKDEIEVIVNEHATTSITFIKNGDLLYYRNHLKKLVSKTSHSVLTETTEGICLNKEKVANIK